AAVEEWVSHCQPCQESRPEMPRAPTQRWESTHTPWSRIHIGFAGLLQGKTFLIIVDSYSKWLEVVDIGSMTLSVVIRELRKVFATHGLPDTVVSDNGAQFTSSEFKDFLAKNLIRHTTSAPFHPATNGQAERMVRKTKDALWPIDRHDWDRGLVDFLLAQHTTPNSTTGNSPAELLMGRRPKTLLDWLHPDLAPEYPGHKDSTATLRVIEQDDPVLARNYGAGPAWIPATVQDTTGLVQDTTGPVATPEGRVLRCHIDQLRRHPANLPEAATVPALLPTPVTRELEQPERPEPPLPLPVTDNTDDPATEGEIDPAPTDRPTVPVPAPRRSQRNRSWPSYLQDFVCS
uniref:uncharacterized protein K02A2.6-like n=1 Tax=Euleptes europaea TaxID=460621 RepID=UPI0025418102